MQRQFCMTEVEKWAEKAIEYAHSQIINGYTEIKSGYCGIKKDDPHLDALRTGVETIRALDEGLELKEKIQNQPLKHPFLVFYESVLATTSKYSLGNCYELTLQALDYVINNVPELHAEIYKIRKSDHAILVLNRIPDSTPSDPSTWGDDAVICDPLAKTFCNAQVYILQNPNLFRSPLNVLHPLSKHNNDSLLEMRSIAKLKANFSKKANSLLYILIDCKKMYDLEMVRLQGTKDPNASIIAQKISDICSKMGLAQSAIERYLQNNYANSELAKSKFNEGIELLNNLIKDASQLSPHQLKFFSHRDKNMTGTILNFMGIKSSTEYHLEEITKLINDQRVKKLQ